MRSIIKKISILLLIGGNLIAQNQNKLFNDYGNGSYTTYKAENQYKSLTGTYSNVLEKVSKQWPLTIQQGSNKDFEGNLIIETITVSRQGVIKENFVPDIAENPVYFSYKDYRLSVIGEKVYYYEWANDNSKIIYILSKGGISSFDSEKATLDEFIRSAFKNQQGAKGKLAEIKKANDIKEAAENSLKGKTIASLEIEMIDVPQELGIKSTVKFGIKAKTKEGKVYSTTNLGGKTSWDDFIVKTTDGVFVEEAIEIHEDASKITNDELKFTVASKHTPAITAQKIIPLNYQTPKYILKHAGRNTNELSQAAGFGIKRGENAKSLELKIQKSLTKNTNLPIYKIEVIDLQSGKIINKLKFAESTVINVDITGGSGGQGTSRKSKSGDNYRKADDGDNGGNGGNITLTKAAGAENINLNIFNSGGKGGKGGEGINNLYNGSSGRDGENGTIQNKTLTGNLAW